MSMGTHVIGLRDGSDPHHVLMVATAKQLEELGIEWPEEIMSYFDGEVNYDGPLEMEIPVRKWQSDSSEGFELNVEDIPDRVVTIRFYNSW